MRLCRYEGWVVVRTWQVSEKSLYSLQSVICVYDELAERCAGVCTSVGWCTVSRHSGRRLHCQADRASELISRRKLRPIDRHADEATTDSTDRSVTGHLRLGSLVHYRLA